MNLLKPLLLTLLLTVPASAQDNQFQSPSIAMSDLEDCVNYAINYSLLVYVAHYSKSEEDFKKFVETQIANQQNPNLAGLVRRFGEEAWLERNSPPSRAGMDVFRQCEASLIGKAPLVKPKIQT